MKDDKNKTHNDGTGKQPPRDPITPQARDEEREKLLQEAFEENIRRYRKTFEALS
jgi:hypothetical protein